MKRALSLGILAILLIGAGVVTWSMFPRPPKGAADVLRPLLDARMRANDSDFSRGSANWKLEEGLTTLSKDQSADADIASVMLLDY